MVKFFQRIILFGLIIYVLSVIVSITGIVVGVVIGIFGLIPTVVIKWKEAKKFH